MDSGPNVVNNIELKEGDEEISMLYAGAIWALNSVKSRSKMTIYMQINILY